MGERYVRLLPSQPASFSVCLVLSEPDAVEGVDAGFCRVGSETSGARHFRAALVSESGLKLADLVVKLPHQEKEEAFFPGEMDDASNASVEARWDRVVSDLAKLQGEPGFFPELVLPAPTGSGSAGPHLPPLLYCSTAGALFPIPCPTCLGALGTWRDDQALAAAGLPVYSATTTRLLHCPTCVAEGRPAQVFVPELGGTGELGAKGVGDLSELRRALAGRIAQAQSAGEPHLASLPCARCEEAGECLGVRDTERTGGTKRKAKQSSAVNWTVFNSHDCPFLVTRLVPLRFEDLVDRLGGRVAGDDPAAAPAVGLLFSLEGSGVDAVEVLTLKLVVFLQLVRAVREYYARLGLPHLDIQPDHVGVELGQGGAYLPELWSFRVRLLTGSSSRLSRLGETADVVLPPRELLAPFSAPAVGEFAQSASRRAELVIDKMVPEPPDGARTRIEGRLGDANGLFPRPGPQDFIVVSVPDDVEGLGGRSILTMLDPRGTRAGVGVGVTSEPIAVDAALQKRLQKAGALRVGLVRYRVYPRLGVDEDRYSLGVMLLRILLVNDRQDLARVFAAVSFALRQALPPEAATPDVLQAVEDAVEAAAKANPSVFAKTNLFYREADRDPGRVNAVPEEAWQSSLRLAFSLLLPRSGGKAGGDSVVADPAPFDLILRDGESLLSSLLGSLFRRQMVNAEIQGVIAELLAETAR